jgi:hypothetical protein
VFCGCPQATNLTECFLTQASVEQKKLTGVVSDAMCGATHMMKDKPDAEWLRY